MEKKAGKISRFVRELADVSKLTAAEKDLVSATKVPTDFSGKRKFIGALKELRAAKELEKKAETNKYLEKVSGFLSTGLKNAAREVGHKSPAMRDELLSRVTSKGFNGKRAYINGVRTEVGKSLSTGASHGSAFKQALMKVK